MPPAGYKRKSTGSLPKKPTAAKFKRLSELEISPLLEIRSTSKALTTSKKQASPEAKAPPSLFNSFSSVSFSPAVIKRRPVYSNALNAKMSSLDQSSSIISKLTGQTYGYKKEEKTTSVEILEQKKKKATTKGKTSAKKAAAHECSPTEPAKNKKYLPRNLFMNDKDVSIEYPTTVNSGKNDKSRNYSKTAEVIQSLDNKQTKVENKKRISNRKSEVMFDALKMIDESATIPTSQVKDAMIKVQNIANSRQNEPPEKLKARIREQEIIFREPKKVPVQTRKIEEPSKKNLDVLTKTTSGVTSDQLMQKFRVEMKSLLSNFYKSCMTKVETNRSTMHDRTEEQAQICGNTKVDSMKMNLEKQTLWRDFEGDLIPMLNGINGELSDITTWESKVQETLKSHFESIKKTRECVKSQVDNILNRMTSYGNSIRERSPMDHTERDKVNDGENSDIVDLKQQENKTEEDSDSVHDSLCALFDD